MDNPSAKEECGEEELGPVERLRFYCSTVMAGQGWIDAEPFFAAVTKERDVLASAIETMGRAFTLIHEEEDGPFTAERLQGVCEQTVIELEKQLEYGLQILNERDALRLFAQKATEGWPDGGDIDGLTTGEWAVEAGLLKHRATAPAVGGAAKEFKRVTQEEFDAHIATLGGEVEFEASGISDPPMMDVNDFSGGKTWPDSVVAKVKLNTRMRGHPAYKGEPDEYYIAVWPCLTAASQSFTVGDRASIKASLPIKLRIPTMLEGIFLTAAALMLAALVFGKKPTTIELIAAEWECTKADRVSSTQIDLIGEIQIPRQVITSMCVEYKRRVE